MKKIFISLGILTSLILLIASSCKKDEIIDDPINEDPGEEMADTLPTPVIYSGTVEMDLVLDSIYSILQRGERVERIEFYGTVASPDAIVGGEPGGGDMVSMQDMMRFYLNPSNRLVRDYWYSMFEGVSLSNRYIYNAAATRDSLSVDESYCSRTIGEAYFLKALFYYKLAIMYCGFPQMQADYGNSLLGVPMIDHFFHQDSIVEERPLLDTTWFKITEFLKSSIDLLPERSQYASNDIGRASRGAAKSLLAKVYVLTEQWESAYRYAQEVINSGEYYLEGGSNSPGPYTVTRLTKEGEVTVNMSGYKWIWQPEANNSAENIFDVQHYADHSSMYPEGQEGSLVPQYYGIRSVLAYDNSGELRSNEQFWGFILPTSYFVETAYKDIGCEDGAGNILDPRYKLTVIAEGDSVPFYYRDETMLEQYPDSALFDAWFNWPCTGYSTWKYFTDPYFVQQRASLGDYPQNTKFLRYADLLLLAAEAAYRTGRTSDALVWVNQVRERARNSGNTGYPLELTNTSIEEIWAERRVELAFEGHQFFDLVRTRRAGKIITQDAMNSGYATVEHPDGHKFFQEYGDNFLVGKSELMPIPQMAIDMSQGKLLQNPGY